MKNAELLSVGDVCKAILTEIGVRSVAVECCGQSDTHGNWSEKCSCRLLADKEQRTCSRFCLVDRQ